MKNNPQLDTDANKEELNSNIEETNSITDKMLAGENENNRGENDFDQGESGLNDADALASGTVPRASAITTIGSNGLQQSNSANGVAKNNNSSGINTDYKDYSDDEDYPVGGNRLDSDKPRSGFWGASINRSTSRPQSPSMMDNMSEVSSQPPIQPPTGSKMKPRTSDGSLGGMVGPATGPQSRYSNLSYWKARRVVFYRNGDPFFPGIEFRFKPGRDIGSLETLLDKISPKMDLPRGARYVFSMDGDRKYTIDELEDGASYVVSSFKRFKVSVDPLLSFLFISNNIYIFIIVD